MTDVDNRVIQGPDELHVGLDVPVHTGKAIFRWAREQQWPEGTELERPSEYHCTLMYSPFGHRDHKDGWWMQHLDQVTVQTKGLDAFKSGDKGWAYVLKLDSPELEAHGTKMQETAEHMGLQITHFPGGYKPHVTIAYGPTNRLNGISAPDFSFDIGPSSVSPPRKESRVAASMSRIGHDMHTWFLADSTPDEVVKVARRVMTSYGYAPTEINIQAAIQTWQTMFPGDQVKVAEWGSSQWGNNLDLHTPAPGMGNDWENLSPGPYNTSDLNISWGTPPPGASSFTPPETPPEFSGLHPNLQQGAVQCPHCGWLNKNHNINMDSPCEKCGQWLEGGRFFSPQTLMQQKMFKPQTHPDFKRGPGWQTPEGVSNTELKEPFPSTVKAAETHGQIPGDETFESPVQFDHVNPDRGINVSYRGFQDGRPVYIKPEGRFHEDDTAAERAAFMVAHRLGIPMPHTAVRKIDIPQALHDEGDIGMPKPQYAQIQDAVPGEPAAINHNYREIHRQFPDQMRRIALLDHVIGNSDRHMGNLIVDPDTGTVYPIDHGGSFGAGGQPRMLTDHYTHKNLTEDELRDLEGLKDIDLKKWGLGPDANKHMHGRIDQMLKHRQFAYDYADRWLENRGN